MDLEIIKDRKDIIYKANFSNLTDLHDYLKRNPKVNKIFRGGQSSLSNDYSFHGESLDKSIDYCIRGYKDGLDSFLKANAKLKEAIKETSDSRKMVRSIYGGVPLAPLVAAGVPDCMLRYDLDTSETVRNIFFSLGYACANDTTQIINRGLATLYIIQALEERGELVNFRAFDFSHVDNEYTNIEINLKKPGDQFLDVGKCYFPLVRKEFLRRILFRVQESVPVEKYEWRNSYGQVVSTNKTREFFNMKDTDIYIPQPKSCGIYGYNIYDDTISLIESLNLEKEFDIQKIKKIKK